MSPSRRTRRAAACLLAGIALTTDALHAAELSATVALTSQYIYRGQSQTDGNPALQAGVDYEHDSGFFAGVWATTLDLESPTGTRDAQLNYYGGFRFPAESAFSLSLAAMRYTFPGQPGPYDYDYTELMLTA